MKHGRQGFITVFIRLAIEGKPIQVFGDGSQLRDFTYVSDAVEAFLLTATTPAAYGEAFNVGGLEPVSLLEVADICQRLADEGGAVETAPWPPEREKIDIGSIYVSHDKLSAATGWEPKVTLEEGLAETIAFYKRHGEHYWS
jgi:nucleoside-diphosphate-sugar epimerase